MTNPLEVDPRLRPFVAGYLDVQLDCGTTAWVRQRVSPPGGAGLTFRWDGEVVLYEAGVPTPVPPRAFTGALSVAGETGCRGTLRMFSVVFHAGGAHALFGLSMAAYADRSVDAVAVLGPWVAEVGDAVAAAPSPEERRRFVEDAFLARMPATPSAEGLTARAIARLVESDTRVTLPQLAASLGTSERTLRRRFLQEVGLPPKVFTRGLRFALAHAYLAQDPARRWGDVVERFGYADQAHLVREFRHFAGQPPTQVTPEDRLYDPLRVRNLQDTLEAAT